MFRTVRVVGHGRLGSAVSARLREQGNLTEAADADLAVLCVPDAAIASVAQTIAPARSARLSSGCRLSQRPIQGFDIG